MTRNIHQIIALAAAIGFNISTYGQQLTNLCHTSPSNGTIVAMDEFNGAVLATGFFTQICGEQASYLAEYDGGSNTLGPSSFNLTDPGHQLRVFDDLLYIAQYEQNDDSNWVRYYDGQTLERLGEGFALTTASGFSNVPNIYDVASFNGQVIACGEFDRIGADTIQSIARWDGTNWLPLGAGLEGSIQVGTAVRFPHQMLVWNDELYVAGNFRFAGGVEVNGLAKWNGSDWEGLGDGFDGTVYAMAIWNDKLWVGGSFTGSGTTPLSRLAWWDGNDWQGTSVSILDSTNTFTFVHTLYPLEDQLFVLGGIRKLAIDGDTMQGNGLFALEQDGAAIKTFAGDTEGSDLEAIYADASTPTLIGGGAIGNGYIGILEEDPSGLDLIKYSIPDQWIYPNPAQGQIYVADHHKWETLQVIDLAGRTIVHKTYGANTALDLSPLNDGIYSCLFRLKGGHHHTEKLVIVK